MENKMNWTIETNDDGTYNLTDNSGNILVTGHMMTIEEYIDDTIADLEELKISVD